MPEPELFRAPDDLSLVSEADLREMETQATAEFDRVRAKESLTDEDITYTQRVNGDLKKIRAELSLRDTRRTETARIEQEERQRQLAALEQQIHPDGGAPAPAAAAAEGGTVDLAALTEAMAKGVVLGLQGEEGAKKFASLSAARDRAPAPKVPDGSSPLAITASVDIPGVAAGQSLPTMEALGEAFRAKAKAIPVTMAGPGASRHLVASMRNQFEHTVDNRTNPAQVEELWHAMVTDSAKGSSAEALIAGGGWCAPSQINYDFFNIAGQPRMIDLPTVGVSRGGLRFPVSPAIGDVFFQNAGSNPASGMGGFAFSFGNGTDPWLWTEADDQATVTGSVNKPTLRVPCPTFNEVRLECYGISLTAGNLTDDAYPESTQNFIKLLRAAYAHAINARLIGLMVTASGGANVITTNATHAIVPRLINSAGLAATDYRNRYAMADDSVLEVVYPFWVLEAMRSDLGYKPGINDTGLYAVADATIMGLFAERNVRPQFVSDWQVRGSSQLGNATVQLAWPTTVNFMLFAAGTFLHGTGLQLDLGVIRDSVLNAENDYTALWAEECHLIAQVGHASRLYTVDFNVGGVVGAAAASGPKI